MKKMVWMLEISDIAIGCHNKVYTSLEKAKQAAYDQLIKWSYNPANDEYEVFKDLEESYNDPNHEGFWIDELLYCYPIEYIE